VETQNDRDFGKRDSFDSQPITQEPDADSVKKIQRVHTGPKSTSETTKVKEGEPG